MLISKLSNCPMKILFPLNMPRILLRNNKDQRSKSGVLMSHVILQYQLTILWVQDHSCLILMEIELIDFCLYGMGSLIGIIYMTRLLWDCKWILSKKSQKQVRLYLIHTWEDRVYVLRRMIQSRWDHNKWVDNLS
jgi:hypothetical protein